MSEATPPGEPVRRERDRLAEEPLSRAERERLATLDAMLIEAVIDGDVLPEILEDTVGASRVHWWWHLGAIRAGSFPLDALPAHLRAVVLEGQA